MTDQTKFGIFFPEGPGYLYRQPCGTGFAAVVSLVCEVGANPALFVRKTILPGADNCSNIAPKLAEVSLYRHHPRIPALTASESYQIIADTHEKCHEVRSDSIILTFCDGGSLDDLFKEEGVPLTVDLADAFAWRIFDDILDALCFIHGHAISHGDAHSGNIFIHWGGADAKLPKFMLGDFGCANDLRLMDQTTDKQPLIRELAVDYDKLTEILAQLITGSFNPCTSVLMNKMAQLRNDPQGFDPELITLFSHLMQIVDDLYAGDIQSYRKYMEKLRQFVHKEATLALSNARDYSWARPSLPPNRPLLFDSRSELLLASGSVPGPWRIAHVNAITLEIQAVETTCWNLHVPEIHEYTPDLESLMAARIPTIDKDGREQVIEFAELMESGAALFTVDPTWKFGVTVTPAETKLKRRRDGDEKVDTKDSFSAWKKSKT